MFESSVADAAPLAASACDVRSALEHLATQLADVTRAADGAAGWTAAERAEVLARLDRLAGLLTTTRARWLLAERDAGTSVRTGDPDFTSAVARRTRGGLGAATRAVQ